MSNPYNTYRIYTAVKRHFETNYNYLQYDGGVRVQHPNKFYSRAGFPRYFEIFNQRYKEGQLLPFFVSNFISGNKRLEDMVNSGDDIFVNWQRRVQSMKYNFSTNVDYLLDQIEDFDELFSYNNSDPIIVKSVYQGEISIETFIIMNELLNFYPQFDKELDQYQWPAFKKMCDKYKIFLNVDFKKYLQILKNKLDI